MEYAYRFVFSKETSIMCYGDPIIDMAYLKYTEHWLNEYLEYYREVALYDVLEDLGFRDIPEVYKACIWVAGRGKHIDLGIEESEDGNYVLKPNCF